MTEYSQKKKIALTKSSWPVETKDGLPLVFSPLLKQYPKLAHAFTTRQGGNSVPPLDSFNIGMPRAADEQIHLDVHTNRARLCQSLDIPFERLIAPARQIHSASVVMIEAKLEPGEVDGIATREIGSPVIMQCADCVPVLIYDPKKNTVCVIHAGWRGTAAQICQEAVQVMNKESDSNAADLVCAIGPSIGPCCYPVGLEVVVKLAQSLTDSEALQEFELELKSEANQEILKDKKWHAKAQTIIEDLDLTGFFNRDDDQIHVDLKAINGYQLLQSGLINLDITDFCTFCQPDLFYSYCRASLNKEGKTGHQGAIACLIPQR